MSDTNGNGHHKATTGESKVSIRDVLYDAVEYVPPSNNQTPWLDVPPMPEPEGDVMLVYTVYVTGYGRETKVRNELNLAVARALHRATPGQWRLITDTGHEVTYDPYADDGNHVGHETPVEEL